MGACCSRHNDRNAQSNQDAIVSSSKPHTHVNMGMSRSDSYEHIVIEPDKEIVDYSSLRRSFDDFDGYTQIGDYISTDADVKGDQDSASDVHYERMDRVARPPVPPRCNQPTVFAQQESDEAEYLYLEPSDLAPPDNPDRRRVYNYPASDSKPMALAEWDYDAKYEYDMCFKKGDIMQLCENIEADGWLFGRNIFTGEEGYGPKNFFAMITRIDIESLRCFVKDISRQTAEAKLSKPEINLGTYLIRSSEGGDYALSIRCEKADGQPEIRHFKLLYSNEVGNGVYYISGRSQCKTFDNIVDLIRYYTNTNDLQCKLKEPLPRETTLDDYAVRFSSIKLGDELGTGNFGSVHAGTLHGSLQVAVKLLKARDSMTVKEFRKEAETMHRLRHPNLVSLLAICEGNLEFLIVTEIMSKGSLLTLLRKNTDGTITLKDLMDMAIQVAEGMCYMEEEGFVHRDIRASNVLIGDDFVTKIGDFGLARSLDINGGSCSELIYQGDNKTAFPIRWTAPEGLRSQKFTSKSDVWSFGILLYEMVTYGGEPYAEISTNEVVTWVEKGNRLQVSTQHTCPSVLYSVMKQCWMKNAEDRSSIADIKQNLVDVTRIV